MLTTRREPRDRPAPPDSHQMNLAECSFERDRLQRELDHLSHRMDLAQEDIRELITYVGGIAAALDVAAREDNGEPYKELGLPLTPETMAITRMPSKRADTRRPLLMATVTVVNSSTISAVAVALTSRSGLLNCRHRLLSRARAVSGEDDVDSRTLAAAAQQLRF